MMMMMILIQAMHGIPYEPSLKRCLTLPFTSPLPHDPRDLANNTLDIRTSQRVHMSAFPEKDQTKSCRLTSDPPPSAWALLTSRPWYHPFPTPCRLKAGRIVPSPVARCLPPTRASPLYSRPCTWHDQGTVSSPCSSPVISGSARPLSPFALSTPHRSRTLLAEQERELLIRLPCLCTNSCAFQSPAPIARLHALCSLPALCGGPRGRPIAFRRPDSLRQTLGRLEDRLSPVGCEEPHAPHLAQLPQRADCTTLFEIAWLS